MAAKHKTKKTVKGKATSSRQTKPVESVIPEQAPATVIPSTSFESTQLVQPVQSVQPTQPIQPQPLQPVQSIQPQPLSDASQPPIVQGASSFENSMTQPVAVPTDISSTSPTGALADKEPSGAEPEIKIGIENKLAPDAEGKSIDPKNSSSDGAEGSHNKQGQKKNLLLPVIFIVLMGVAVLGGLFIYRQNFSNKVEEKINEVSLSPTPVKKPTAAPVDLTKFDIKVLNGSGIAGEASSQQSNLEGAGFKVASIGNADNSDYAETVIQAKKTVDKAYLDKLKAILEKSFAVAEIEDLDEDSETDIVVIIGSTKAE